MVGVTERLEVVVRFLAVLELFKQGVVDMEQATTFGDLVVRRLGEDETALDQISLDDWDDEPATPPARPAARPFAATEAG